ncbi:MAG TPA: hypothetical protein PKJ52_09745 [Rectinema sp.]|nr:hypothetical protein [Rectinema sp.]
MNQTKGITEEEIRTSSDQWWWIQDEFDNREMNDPDCPEDFEPVYHICRCMADSEGVCSTCFNMPAFGATNRAAWLYENGFISGTATKRDIKNEAFLDDENFDKLHSYYTEIYKMDTIKGALEYLIESAPIIEIVSMDILTAVFPSTAAMKEFWQKTPDRIYICSTNFGQQYALNHKGLIDWEQWR